MSTGSSKRGSTMLDHDGDPMGLSEPGGTGNNGSFVEMDETYLEVLRLIEHGTISAEEGEMLLEALDVGSEPKVESSISILAGPRAAAEESETWQSGPPAWAQGAWIVLLTGGVLLIGLAGMATALLVAVGSRPGWLVCTLPLMLMGALAIALASWSRTARWLHVRVRDQDTRFRISLPLPLRPAAWLARLARPFVPNMQDIPVDQMILALAEMEGEGPLVVEVGEAGEEVQVYLG
jgi:hypothetical protein